MIDRLRRLQNPARKVKEAVREVEPALRKMGARLAQGEDDFLDLLTERANITYPEAERVLAYYRKHKLVTRDAVSGRIMVKHGAYLDEDTILRALALS